MTTLPVISLSIATSLFGIPTSGVLEYMYKPFVNLNTAEAGLSSLRLLTSEAGVELKDSDIAFTPIELDVEPAYDGSANLIFTDKDKSPRLVNSRFYLTSSSTYKIADRKGNIDTNIYSKENFINESSLVKKVSKITKLDYLGIYDGGKMPVGNYTFYFKLADADDNMTDFISESGKVICHMGGVNNPSTIRGGQQNENSEKLIKFKLFNLDQAYQYIRVYYIKTTGTSDLETMQTFFIQDKYKITGDDTTITITGYENHTEISSTDINIQYASFESVKTLTKAQNLTFVGNITNNYELFSTLEQLSLRITPNLVQPLKIGRLDGEYRELHDTINGFEYYNTKNIYYKLGYWDEEIYRFGIVYILNDFTLSPVFNIRGVNNLTQNYAWNVFGMDEISIDDNNIIWTDGTSYENSKGVVRLDAAGMTNITTGQIKPLGLTFTFEGSSNGTVDIVNGKYGSDGLAAWTKGFFIVRQKRIPNILAQGVGIATSSKGYFPMINSQVNDKSYFVEAFLKIVATRPKLGSSIQFINTSVGANLSKNNAILCPEANIRKALFNTFFNSSEYQLTPCRYKGKNYFTKSFTTNNLYTLDFDTIASTRTNLTSKLTLVEPGIELIGDGINKFSSKAGNETVPWKHIDPEVGNIEDIAENLTKTDSHLNSSVLKIRGIFNTFIGTSVTNLNFGQYYNIYQKGFNFTTNWSEYFRVRYNDTSPFMPISDRMTWDQLVSGTDYVSPVVYRGDCYINTYTQRMNWNFIDPELPTNTRILDPYTWYKNYRIKTITVKTAVNSGVTIDDNDNSTTDTTGITSYTYQKALPIFTYRINNLDVNKVIDNIDSGTVLSNARILTADDKKFKKYSEANGLFGCEKINRPDVNAVPLGHWASVKICSNTNLAMRDVDFNNPLEEALHRQKRSFYPLQASESTHKLPESDALNRGISKTLGDKYYFEIPDVPFIKTTFPTRIYHSNILVDTAFQNGNRVFEAKNYQDYTMEYGALVKLVEWYGSLIAVMEHGVLFIPVNERAMMTNANGENVYINTDTVLPKNPKVLSNTFGSIWADSVTKTSKFIYGLDTIGKKVWRTNGQTFEVISDMKIQKFLNDNISLKVTDTMERIGTHFIKSHYNAFKQDVTFVFVYENVNWHLCYNELLGKWITRYTWFPEFSENINNIFYTFANQLNHTSATNKLYKHGFAGTDEEMARIKHTKWYDEQHKFEFEFVVIGVPGVQKIFDNLKIISNKTEPYSFDCEIVGEGYDWYMYKEIVSWINNHGAWNSGFVNDTFQFLISEGGAYQIQESAWADQLSEIELGYKYVLSNTLETIKAENPTFPMPWWISSDRWSTYKLPKLPFIPKSITPSPLDGVNWDECPTKTVLINDPWNGEDRVVSNQAGLNFVKYGRMKGNMHYVEDSWDIQIQPVKLRYAYLKNAELVYTPIHEMKVRDKYTKIRVKYDGIKHAIVNSIRTLFTLSHA